MSPQILAVKRADPQTDMSAWERETEPSVFKGKNAH
jgi:hypothetical protein